MAKEISVSTLKLQSAIKWIGMVRLHQLNEDDQSYLGEIEYPIGSGQMVYACASTGLLFDKQSGRCLQSSKLDLLVDTVGETKCTAGQFEKWRKARTVTGVKHITLKRGPKPKGSVPVNDLEFDYAEVD